MWSIPNHESFEWRRHESLEENRSRTDFEIIKMLGKGAFGTAYHVRNRIDSKEYALKKVLLPKKDADRGLREVQVLSQLESPHVVRYFGAWIEQDHHQINSDDEEGGSSSVTSSYDESTTPSSRSQQGMIKDATFPGDQPTCGLCNTKYNDWEVSLEQWGLIEAVLHPLDLCVPCYMKSLPRDVDKSRIQIRPPRDLSSFLYILMELCGSTLQEIINKHRGDGQKMWSCFEQCVQGVSYLHSKGVIHRDIKPGNIFVHDNIVKIGDLGLATKFQHSTAELQGAKKSRKTKQSSHVGTYLYSAPEVDKGVYDYSVDVYSLGVLLVEMFSSFSTGMERIVVLERLRKPSSSEDDDRIHEAFVKAYPIQADLAKRMTSSDPVQRPACADVLKELGASGSTNSKGYGTESSNGSNGRPFLEDSAITDSSNFEKQIDALTARVRDLEMELRRKESENVQLRRLLKRHQIEFDGDHS